jgi:MFS family permease
VTWTSDVVQQAKAAGRDDRTLPLLAIAGSSFLLIGVQMVYPVLLPELRVAYGLSFTTAGLLISLLWGANAIGQLPGGLVADRFGDRSTILASVLLSGIAISIIVLAPALIVLFLATVLLGLGIALFGVARYTALHHLYDNRFGLSIGLTQAAADGGQALLPPISGYLAILFVWQYGFGYTLPLFVLVTVGLYQFLPEQTVRDASRQGTPPRDLLGTVVSSMRTSRIQYGTGTFAVYALIWVAFTSFYPTYLTEYKGQSPTVAGLVFGLFFAFGVIVKPVCGVAYDQFTTRGSLVVVASFPAVGMAVLPSVSGTIPIILVTLSIAPILGSGTIAQSYLIDTLPDPIRGKAFGVIRSVVIGWAAMSPVIFGALADRGLFDSMYLMLAALAVVMMVFAARIPSGDSIATSASNP